MDDRRRPISDILCDGTSQTIQRSTNFVVLSTRRCTPSVRRVVGSRSLSIFTVSREFSFSPVNSFVIGYRLGNEFTRRSTNNVCEQRAIDKREIDHK